MFCVTVLQTGAFKLGGFSINKCMTWNPPYSEEFYQADQAGQSSSQKACQALSRPTFPDCNVLPGTGFRSLDLTDEDREIINRIDDMIVKQPYSQTSPPLAAVQTE